ncbi:metal ABC transporter substrate-binding protein [Brachybacterium paraconglomeratum]|uniref:metal ABC transporter substrate-binding protein n=1 Tax=Brachybacterium paraconglomeratum TaxID=173362 RepID=UPI0021A7B5AF|nr:metal ABC transporter substrate-binding protein [Brachybacterium paraconglomeratum]MCT1907765.1 metal ABC transporter substrate-binding protein [Brachybacterium paraconglomeratum]
MSHASPLRRRTLLSALGLGAGAALLAACGEGMAADGDGLSVVTSAYALRFLVTRIGGEHVALTDLTTPGADAHGLELSVKQTMLVEEADLVLQIPGFQTALDDAIASQGGDNVLDVSSVITLLPADAGSAEEGHAGESEEEHAEHAEEGDSREGHDHGPNDPHFWHDPLRMADLGDAIAARLGELSPENAEEFTSAAATVREELEQLDAELTSAFEEVADERRTFITSHAAYTYLADRYDLHQVGISGIDPETEPSPQRLLALETVVRDEEVTTIFFEATASPKVAQTLADNLGIDSAELDNLEPQQSPEADYPAVMRSNCTALAESWA